MKNPLLESSKGPFGTIPFNDLSLEHFVPAISHGIKYAEHELQEITNCEEQPTFENTVLALETSGQILSTATRVYYHLFGSESDQNFKDLSDTISPMLAELENNIYLNQNFNSGDKMEYSQRFDSSIGDQITNTLHDLEENGGSDAFINIKYLVPTYQSVVIS